MQAAKILLASAFTDVGRQAEVGKVPQLYAYAAYALLRLGQYLQALEQLEQGKTFYRERFGSTKFLAYFQTFTNTYLVRVGGYFAGLVS